MLNPGKVAFYSKEGAEAAKVAEIAQFQADLSKAIEQIALFLEWRIGPKALGYTLH